MNRRKAKLRLMWLQRTRRVWWPFKRLRDLSKDLTTYKLLAGEIGRIDGFSIITGR